MRRIVAAIASAWFAFAPVFGQAETSAKSQTVNVEEARELVYALLAPTGCTKAKCDVELLPDKYFPRLYFFEGLWPNPSGSPHIGSWAVDPATGDLWDANVCVEYKNSRITKLQLLLRKRIGLTQGAYAKVKGRPPMCEADEKVEYRDRY
jgi:hypothetical protein